MPIIKYQDIRGVDKNSNPLTTFRPSGKMRIFKGTLQYALFQASFTYGFLFNGFGLHSYFYETIGKIQRVKPWMRTQTLGTSFVKYGILGLPFFYSKQVIFSTIDSFTKDKPTIRKLLNYSFVVNFIATGFIFPFFYLFQKRNFIKAVRGSLALCLFSMVNDFFLDYRRKQLIVRNYTRQQLQQIYVKGRISEVREQLKEDLKDGNLSKQQRQKLENLNLQLLQKHMLSRAKPKTYQSIQAQRKEQLQKVGQSLRQTLNMQLNWFKNLVNMFQQK